MVAYPCNASISVALFLRNFLCILSMFFPLLGLMLLHFRIFQFVFVINAGHPILSLVKLILCARFVTVFR